MNVSSILQTVLPIAGGFAGGLIIPKLLKVPKGDIKNIIFPAGAGILTIVFGRHLVGRKTATMIGAGMLGASVVAILDKFVFTKTASIGSVLGDDFPSLADVQAGVMGDVEANSLAGVSSVPGLTADENNFMAEDSDLSSNMYNRYGKYDENS